MKDIGFLSILPEMHPGKIMRRVIKALLTKKEMGELSTNEEEASTYLFFPLTFPLDLNIFI